MSRKLKLALLTLLGFAPACSTVKTAGSAAAAKPADSVEWRTIRVMYGVRPPVESKGEKPAADSVVVRAYSDAPRRVMTAYGVRSPKDTLVDHKDTIGGFKCIMPPAPKDFDK